MAGPSRTNGKARPGPICPQPPRPPNAWILYRSDKLRELTARRDPSAPKRLQADISKEIADLWKAEDPEVRHEYERIADIKKQEHAATYPGYKFQPVKKEDKAKRREEEKAERARVKEELKKAKARHVPYIQQHQLGLPQPQPMPYIHPNYPYCPAGPSPPLSAASSPMCTPSPLSIAGDLDDDPQDSKGLLMLPPPRSSVIVPSLPSRPPTARQQPEYDPRMPPPPVPQKVQLPPAPLTPESISPPSASTSQTVELPMVDASSASTSAHADAPSIVVSSDDPGAVPAQPEGEDIAMDVSNEAGPSNMELDFGFMNSNQLELMPMDTDMLQFEMPLSDLVELDWLQPEAAPGGDDFVGANANVTNAPGVYELASIPTAEFNVFPPPGMNVEVGVMSGPLRTAQPEEVSVFAELLNGLDWSMMPGGSLFGSMQSEGDGQAGGNGDGMDMDPTFDANMMQEHPRSVTQNDLLQQFFNFNQLAEAEGSGQDGDSSTSSTATPPNFAELIAASNGVPAFQGQPPSSSVSAPLANQYTPPSGAANFEKRRVAGSWKASPRA